MAITFQLEDALESQLRRDLGNLDEAAKEALLIEAYRRGKLSIGRLARTLGIGVLQADEWLAKHGIALNYTIADFDDDKDTLRNLKG
jgi:predicted HTH domain antitoxin